MASSDHHGSGKAPMSTTSELKDFVSSAGSKLLVIDVRHPDASVEPSDAKSIERTGLPDPTKNYRPQAINLPWSRASNSMELPNVDKDTPIITHCGGGWRGQEAKEYLEKHGFTNVLNGGGPREQEEWHEFGSL
jgi:rhodanese-related sulfurtransferase